jgi:hypothetical protein
VDEAGRRRDQRQARGALEKEGANVPGCGVPGQKGSRNALPD